MLKRSASVLSVVGEVENNIGHMHNRSLHIVARDIWHKNGMRNGDGDPRIGATAAGLCLKVVFFRNKNVFSIYKVVFYEYNSNYNNLFFPLL